MFRVKKKIDYPFVSFGYVVYLKPRLYNAFSMQMSRNFSDGFELRIIKY